MTPQPRLVGSSTISDPAVVVLLLHGGRQTSAAAVRANQLAVLRMVPLARAAARAGTPAYRLRYRVRGWNATGTHTPDPVRDTRWALEELRRRHGEGIRVVLVGHSMGGRTALWVGGDPGVAGVLALAPWCDTRDAVGQLAGQDVVIAHGTRDRITSPQASLDFARRALAAGARVRRLEVERETHGLLHRRRVWDDLVTGFVTAVESGQSAASRASNPLTGEPLTGDPLRVRV